MSSIKKLLIGILSAGIISCSASGPHESAGEFLDSAAVTAKVKAHLLDNLGSKALQIKVKTYKDEIQLSGFVDNANIKQRAGVLAASVQDVAKVHNNLIVK